MRSLTLLRHAKSSWDDDSLDDFDRPLNDRGRKAARAIGRHLADEGVSFDLILASPARRVVETLDGLAAGGWEAGHIQFERAIYSASTADLLNLVRAAPDKVKRLMLVGHNPVLAMLAVRLAEDDAQGLRAAIAGKYPTGGLAEIALAIERWRDADENCGRVTAFTTPRSLTGA